MLHLATAFEQLAQGQQATVTSPRTGVVVVASEEFHGHEELQPWQSRRFYVVHGCCGLEASKKQTHIRTVIYDDRLGPFFLFKNVFQDNFYMLFLWSV